MVLVGWILDTWNGREGDIGLCDVRAKGGGWEGKRVKGMGKGESGGGEG